MREVGKHREVTHFMLFGSASNGRWRPGSDVDIVICLSKNSKEARKSLLNKFWGLDEKYGTGIIDAKMMHPPIVFLWGWRKELFKTFIRHNLLMKTFRGFDRIQRKFKRFAPRYKYFYSTT